MWSDANGSNATVVATVVSHARAQLPPLLTVLRCHTAATVAIHAIRAIRAIRDIRAIRAATPWHHNRLA